MYKSMYLSLNRIIGNTLILYKNMQETEIINAGSTWDSLSQGNIKVLRVTTK